MTRAEESAINRILDVPGAINLRDFGGYSTIDGGRVRRSLLYRSGMLAGLTSEGQQALRELGIGVICDLRRDDERTLEPTPFPAHDPHQVVVSIDPDKGVKSRLLKDYSGLDVAGRIAYMIEINRELAVVHTRHYRRVFDALWSAGETGFLIHCAAGKDRTGFGVAAIQLLLGVPRETVVEDYLLTNDALDFEGFIVPRLRPSYGDVDVAQARALSGARAEFINAALDAVDDEYGSFDAYLERGLGIDAHRRAALRARYLE